MSDAVKTEITNLLSAERNGVVLNVTLVGLVVEHLVDVVGFQDVSEVLWCSTETFWKMPPRRGRRLTMTTTCRLPT